jgi:hypothetical protein
MLAGVNPIVIQRLQVCTLTVVLCYKGVDLGVLRFSTY